MTYSSVILADSPLAYYKLDETSGTTAADASGNGRDGTYTNAPTLGASSLLDDATGHAMSTAADSNQYVSAGFASWMNVNTFTVEGWAKFTAYDSLNGDPIVSRYTSADGYPMFLGRKYGGSATPGIQVVVGSTRYDVFGSTAVPDNETHHYAATYDGTTIRAYLDGVEVASQAASGAVAWSSSPLEIARYSQTSTTVPGATIDEVAFYNTVLSASRVAAHYEAGASIYKEVVLADAPLVYYRLDETSGTTAIDVSGGGNNGTYSSSPTLGVAGALAGDSDTAVTFVAASSHTMQTAFWSALNITTLTLECWVKTTGANQAICGRQGGTSVPYSMFVDASGKLQLVIKTSGTSGTNYSDTSSTIINDGAWHYVAITRDNTTAIISFYVDGVLTSSIASTSAPNITTSFGFAVSGRGGTPRLDGTVDEVALYGTALSAARIAKHYAVGASRYAKEVIPDAPLAYYRLGEASGTTALDSSGNGRNSAYNGTYTLGATGAIDGDDDTALDLTTAPGGYTSLATQAWMNIGSTITVECWAKQAGDVHDANPSNAAVLVARDSTSDAFSNRNWYVYANNSGAVYWRAFGASSQRFSLGTSTTPLSDGKWHHVACTYNGSVAKIFVDGIELASGSASGTLNSSRALTIGRAEKQLADGLRYFNGVVDEVAMYGTALSSTRIAIHYAAGVPVLSILTGEWGMVG